MNIIYKFLTLLKVSYNKKTVYNFFNTHANHPSILSFSDLLDNFNVDNAAVRIGKENFNKIDTPFIAKTQSSDGDFCLIEKIEKDNLTYLNEKNEIKTEKLEHFFLQYSGIVLVAESNQQSIEPNYLNNKNKYLYEKIKSIGLALILFISLFLYLININSNLQIFIVFFLKIFGIATSFLLLLQSIDINNPFINKLCSTSSGNGCNNILNSPDAKIFKGKLTWSEVGLFYFLSTFLLLILTPFLNTLITLSVIALFAFTFTFYSIIYQFKKNQWCKLCLFVQLILVLEFIAALFQLNINSDLRQTFIPFIYLTAILFIFILIWFNIKPLFLNTQIIIKLNKDLNQFKKDENIFNTLLLQQKKVKSLDKQHSFILGNPKATFEITFVSNPYCNPCSELHKEINDLLLDEDKNIKVNIIFTVSSIESEPKNIVIAQLITMYQNIGSNISKYALDEWYNTKFKNTNNWFSKYNYNISDSVKITMEQHRIWCDENEITHTPTLFINNYQYLSEYTFTDLKHFIHLASKHNVSKISHI